MRSGSLRRPARRSRAFRELVAAADATRDARDWARAETLYRNALAQDPTRLGLRTQLGHMLKELGRLDEAAAAYAAVLAARPGDPDIHLQIGHLEKRRGDLARALQFYRQALALAPGDLDARRALALLHEGDGPAADPEFPAAPLGPDSFATVWGPAPATALRPELWLEDTAEERLRIARMARLYGLVQGRPADRAGLCEGVAQLRAGAALRDLVKSFVRSPEFAPRRADLPPALAQDEETLVAWLARIIDDPAAEVPVLRGLYPDGVPLQSGPDYRLWLAHADTPRLPAPPPSATGARLLSCVAVITGARPAWRDAMIDSVLGQGDGAELVLVSRRPHAAPLRRRAGADPRLRLVMCAPWMRDAGAFHRGLRRCGGAFAAWLGPHDILQPGALAALAAHADTADILLADTDSLAADGRRHSPQLAGCWDPDRVVARPGGRGFQAIRTDLLRQRGGARPPRGGEPWAMLLETAAAVPADRIVHVPALLLSRRAPHPAPNPGPAHEAAARRFLAATGRPGSRVVAESGLLRVFPALPAAPPRASLIVPTRDRAALLRKLMAGVLERTDYPDLEVLILDNGSREPDARALLDALAGDPRVRCLDRPGPFNWSALNNAGVAAMTGDVAVLLNNDIEVLAADWLRELVAQALRPDVGIVGARLLYPDRTVQHAGAVLGPGGRSTHMWRHQPAAARGYLDELAVVREVSAVTGACLAIRRAVYERAGGCDGTLPVTWNDTDLCLRVRALGLRVICTPHAELLHLEQASRGSDASAAGADRLAREGAVMRARWGALLDRDPFIHPALRPSERQPLLCTGADEPALEALLRLAWAADKPVK